MSSREPPSPPAPRPAPSPAWPCLDLAPAGSGKLLYRMLLPAAPAAPPGGRRPAPAATRPLLGGVRLTRAAAVGRGSKAALGGPRGATDPGTAWPTGGVTAAPAPATAALWRAGGESARSCSSASGSNSNWEAIGCAGAARTGAAAAADLGRPGAAVRSPAAAAAVEPCAPLSPAAWSGLPCWLAAVLSEAAEGAGAAAATTTMPGATGTLVAPAGTAAGFPALGGKVLSPATGRAPGGLVPVPLAAPPRAASLLRPGVEALIPAAEPAALRPGLVGRAAAGWEGSMAACGALAAPRTFTVGEAVDGPWLPAPLLPTPPAAAFPPPGPVWCSGSSSSSSSGRSNSDLAGAGPVPRGLLSAAEAPPAASPASLLRAGVPADAVARRDWNVL
ncbi:hypothetical protein V8C86DRAFT_2685281 [Haematococcus lacustris]